MSGVCLALLVTVVKAQSLPYQQVGLPVSQRVDDLLERMTLEEKIAQIRHLQCRSRICGRFPSDGRELPE